MPVLNWRELQSLNKNRQETGTDESTQPEWLEGFDESAPNAYEEKVKRFQKHLLGDTSPEGRHREIVESSLYRSPRESYTNEDALAAGYGQKEEDLRVPFSHWIENPVDARANSQSWMEKFGNGAYKMIPYFASTLLDNTIGTALGLASIVNDATNGDGEFHGRESFINNYGFGAAMQAWRDDVEKRVPNFRTTEEIEDADEWWKHLNGNFWGDTFLKNFGFTLGAGAAFWGWGKGTQALLGKIHNKAYKTAMAAAAGDSEAEAAFQSVLRGGAMENPTAVYKTFDRTSKAFNRLNWESQIIGGIGGATGEARMEALMAAKEFRDEQLEKESLKYQSDKQALFKRVSEDDDFTDEIDGNKYLTKAGEDYLNIELKNLQDKYSAALTQIDNEATLLAKRTFSLNMPILTASNIIMFGRLASGGFNTQAKTKLKFKNGQYVPNVSKLGMVARPLGYAASEGFEELTQKMASEGSKDIASSNMAAFHNGQYDKESIKWGSEWLMSMLNSAGNVALDPKSWEEFAVGFLTGAIGMPAKGGWSGGVIGGVQEASNQRKDSAEAAEKLNNVISRPGFMDQWRSVVRHNKLENQKDIALSDNNRFAWKTADDEQMISDVMAFAKAGQLDDLEAIVDSFGKVDEGDIRYIKDDLIDETDLDFSNKSDSQLVEWLHDRANSVKKTIRQYRRFHDAVDFMAMGTTDDEVINEVIYTKSQLENFEERYNNIISDVLNELKPRLQEVSQRRDSMDNFTKEAKTAQKILGSEASLRTLFGGAALDVQGREDKVATLIDDAQQNNIISLLEDLEVFSDKPETKQKVEDLQKLVRSRQAFYSRLFFPDNRKSFAEQFARDARTDNDVVEELNEDAKQNYVNRTLQTIKSQSGNLRGYIRMMNSLTAPSDDYEDALLDAVKNDADLSKFEDILDDADSFVKGIEDLVAKKIRENSDPSLVDVYSSMERALMGIEAMQELADINDTDEPTIHLARKILSRLATSPEAESEIRKIFDELLSDKAQSNNLGVIATPPGAGTGTSSGTGTGTGDNGTGGTGGSGGAGGGSVTSYDHIRELISNISDVYNKELEKFANGDFSGYDDLDERQMSELIGLASSKLTQLKIEAGIISDPNAVDPQVATEIDVDTPSRRLAKRQRQEKEISTISGSHIQYYAPGSTNPSISSDPSKVASWGLRQGVKKRFTEKTPGMQATLDWFKAHKVQDFVDSGALMALERDYQKTGEHLPIYIVANPHYVENNLGRNPFVTKNTNKESKYGDLAPEMLFAIEMNDRNRSVLERFEGTAFTNDTLIDVNDNGTNVKYQVIGEAWNPHPNYIKDKPEDLRESYIDMKSHVQKLWEHAIFKSIIPQYRADKNAIGDDGMWYVAKNHPKSVAESGDTDVSSGERIYTTLNYVMSGRNETRTPSEPRYQKIELRTSLKSYKDIGGDYYFAMPTKEEVVISANKTREVSFPLDIHAPLGSLWMATRTANGKFSWSYVDIARAGEYDFEANSNTSLIQQLNRHIDALFNNGSRSNNAIERRSDFAARSAACKAISDMFYLGEGNTVSFYYTPSGLEVDIAGRVCRSKQDVFDALSEGNYRFQIDASTVYDGTADMQKYIDAGVLRSEMRSFIRMGATFGVNFLEDTDADGNKVELHPVSNNEELAFTAGESTVTDYSNNNGVSDIRIVDTGYRLVDGKVYYMAAGNRLGEEVTSRERVAQVKSLAEVLNLMTNTRHDNKRVAIANYPGKAWVVKRNYPVKNKADKTKSYQYVELYEREMDGIKVHMARWGENGSVQLVWDDSVWDDLMELSKEVEAQGNKYKREVTQQEQAADDAAILAEFDRMRAEEEGGSVAPPTPTRRGRVNKPMPKKSGPKSMTLQQKQKEDNKTIDKTDC